MTNVSTGIRTTLYKKKWLTSSPCRSFLKKLMWSPKIVPHFTPVILFGIIRSWQNISCLLRLPGPDKKTWFWNLIFMTEGQSRLLHTWRSGETKIFNFNLCLNSTLNQTKPNIVNSIILGIYNFALKLKK